MQKQATSQTKTSEASPLSSLAQAAFDAWMYTLPLIETAGARASALKAGKPNVLAMKRDLGSHKNRRVTTPNNDTLYASGWIDLSSGPARMTLPATGDRYASVAFMDMYTNNFAVLGTRTTGPDGGTFTIVGPNDATSDSQAIRSPTSWTWMIVRILTTGGDDLAVGHAIQDGFLLDAPEWKGSLREFASRTSPWQDYFASASMLLRESPPPSTDSKILHRIAPLNLQHGFDAKSFSEAEGQEIAVGVSEAQRQLKNGRWGTVVDGWAYPPANIGVFDQDYRYRAQVSLNALAALPKEEAMYMFATTPDGNIELDGSKPWRLHLPRDLSVDAFWSLTIYEATGDGQFFLFDNPIHRYAIGDRTPGLYRNGNGGLEILIQRDRPQGPLAANWLPAPPDKSFGVMLRAYLPGSDFLNGSYRLPPLQQI
jgi:hypothetical protein